MYVDCTWLYSLWFYRGPWFPLLFHTQIRDPSIEMKVFSPRYLQALQHFSMPVVDASRYHLCCPYCSARTTIQLAGLLRRGSWPRSWRNVPKLQGPFGHSEMRQIHVWNQKPESEQLMWSIIELWRGCVDFSVLNLHLFGILKASLVQLCCATRC